MECQTLPALITGCSGQSVGRLIIFELRHEKTNILHMRKQRRQGSKCPSLPGLTHWVNPGLPGLGFKPYFGKVGNTGE